MLVALQWHSVCGKGFAGGLLVVVILLIIASMIRQEETPTLRNSLSACKEGFTRLGFNGRTRQFVNLVGHD
jgi:hypothetical protein